MNPWLLLALTVAVIVGAFFIRSEILNVRAQRKAMKMLDDRMGWGASRAVFPEWSEGDQVLNMTGHLHASPTLTGKMTFANATDVPPIDRDGVLRHYRALKMIAGGHVASAEMPNGHIWSRTCPACNAEEIAEAALAGKVWMPDPMGKNVGKL